MAAACRFTGVDGFLAYRYVAREANRRHVRWFFSVASVPRATDPCLQRESARGHAHRRANRTGKHWLHNVATDAQARSLMCFSLIEKGAPVSRCGKAKPGSSAASDGKTDRVLPSLDGCSSRVSVTKSESKHEHAFLTLCFVEANTTSMCDALDIACMTSLKPPVVCDNSEGNVGDAERFGD